MGFPVSWPDVNKHFYDAIGEAAEAIGAVPHPSWGGFTQPEKVAPAGSPDWTGFGSEKSAQAMALIADLTALLKSNSYPAHVGTETLARADAFLEHGDEAFREVDPGPAIGGAFEEGPTLNALRGLVGLIQLFAHNDAMPKSMIHLLLTSHRYIEALDVLGMRRE